MRENHIELKKQRDVGEMITTYFDFLKQNFKPFLNIFISYNGIFILGFLGVSYLMVTGFVGTFASTSNFGIVENTSNHEYYLMAGVIGFLLLFMITAILNYSLAAVYTIKYERNETPTVNKKEVWEMIMANIGKISLFIFLTIVLYVVVMIVGIILAIIPILGTFAYYLLILAFMSWMGLSFMSMLHNNMDVTEAYTEGWQLMKQYFWKSILTNLVIGMLLGILILVILMVPGILVGIYAFHSLDTGVDLANSPVANVVWTVALSIVLVVYALNQSLSQFVNGILYFSVHEETYNEATRTKIDQIGAGE